MVILKAQEDHLFICLKDLGEAGEFNLEQWNRFGVPLSWKKENCGPNTKRPIFWNETDVIPI